MMMARQSTYDQDGHDAKPATDPQFQPLHWRPVDDRRGREEQCLAGKRPRRQ
jgi:hypothetical protein